MIKKRQEKECKKKKKSVEHASFSKDRLKLSSYGEQGISEGPREERVDAQLERRRRKGSLRGRREKKRIVNVLREEKKHQKSRGGKGGYVVDIVRYFLRKRRKENNGGRAAKKTRESQMGGGGTQTGRKGGRRDRAKLQPENSKKEIGKRKRDVKMERKKHRGQNLSR